MSQNIFVHLSSFLKRIPKVYKEGPWHPFAFGLIGTLLFYLLSNIGTALEDYAQTEVVSYKELQSDLLGHDGLQWLRLVMGLYQCIFTIWLISYTSWFPLVTYTITSWNVLTLRNLLSYVEASKIIEIPHLTFIARLLRFPAILMNSITCAIWWFACVPIMYTYFDKERREAFIKFNKSFALINVHLLNLPFAIMEFIATGTSMNYFDLYCGLWATTLYALFYLMVLDPRGIHLYIVITPRTVYSVFTYSFVVGAHFLIYNQWNTLLPILSSTLK